MIVVFFGQPTSGKTTLCKEFFGWFKRSTRQKVHYMDGDKFRAIFKNKDYSRSGRIKNLNLAADIAKYERSLNDVVLMAFVYPYEECRKYLEEQDKQVMWVYLKYNKADNRGRESFHVEDFEEPINPDLVIDTSTVTLNESLNLVIDKFRNYGK
jgi:adenylylsulfate kinase